MRLSFLGRRTLGVAMLLVGFAALPLMAGLTRTARASADATQSYPITSMFGDTPLGIIQVAPSTAGTQLTILVSAGFPRMTYAISSCTPDLIVGTIACVTSPLTLTTNAGGGGQLVINIPAGVAVAPIVGLTDTFGYQYFGATQPGVLLPAGTGDNGS